jgi:TolB protein
MKWIIHGMVMLSLGAYWGMPVASARLNIEITQGIMGAVPIAVMPFTHMTGPTMQAKPDLVMSQLLAQDLQSSGRFRPISDSEIPNTLDRNAIEQWRQLGVENVVVGSVQALGGDRYNVAFELWDVFKVPDVPPSMQLEYGQLMAVKARPAHILAAKKYSNIREADCRALGHHISDVIYETLTGNRGAFSTRIAYISVQTTAKGASEFVLEVADADGHGAQAVVRSKEPIMSPTWSPDGKQLAFVSFENKRSEIYAVELQSGKRRLLTHFPGINGAPSWSPNGRQLALVLSKDGSPKIYTLDLATHQLQQITQGHSIDTEPSWDPSGQSLFFTSNRGGRPQIYRVQLKDRKIERITYEGHYNARAMPTPDGQRIVMVHRQATGGLKIATQDLNSHRFKILTNAQFDESPSLSPNGTMVVYATTRGEKRALGLVTIDGRGHLRLPAQSGNVQEPSWSPFLS